MHSTLVKKTTPKIRRFSLEEIDCVSAIEKNSETIPRGWREFKLLLKLAEEHPALDNHYSYEFSCDYIKNFFGFKSFTEEDISRIINEVDHLCIKLDLIMPGVKGFTRAVTTYVFNHETGIFRFGLAKRFVHGYFHKKILSNLNPTSTDTPFLNCRKNNF